MLSNRTGRWTAAAALLCVVLLAASWFLLISPRRDRVEGLPAPVPSADSEARQAQQQTAQLKAEFGDLAKKKADLAKIKRQLTPKAAMSQFVNDLAAHAASSGVLMTQLTVGVPALDGITSGTGGSTALAPAGSVVAIPITVTATGDYFESVLFVKDIQTQLTRVFLAKSVAVSNGSANTSVPAVTSTATPTVTATATATATATPTPTATTTASTSTLTMNGSVFVLVDSATTLRQIEKDAKSGAAAAAG
jgi:Tfp pilus assembly protein PilO